MTGFIIIQKDKKGQFYVTVKAKNNRVLFTARGYNTRANALKGFLALQKALHSPHLIYK